MAKKRVCRGGVCSLQNLPAKKSAKKKKAPISALNRASNKPMNALNGGLNSAINPANVQASLSPLNMQPQQQNPLNYIGGQPEQFIPYETSPVNVPLSQDQNNQPQQGAYNPQSYLQGPLQGLVQGGWYSPYNQQQQYMPQQYVPQQNIAAPSISVPSPTAQSTAIPGGQVLHPNAKQRGAVGRTIKGTKPQTYNTPLYTQYQNDVMNQLARYGLQGLMQEGQQQYDPTYLNRFDFAPIGNQELERFYTQTVPSLAERFTALGDGQRSSAFQGSLAQAGRGLGNDLAAQQQQYNLTQQQLAQQQNQFQQGLGLQRQGLYASILNAGLQPQFQTSFMPGKNGILPGVTSAAGSVLKRFL